MIPTSGEFFTLYIFYFGVLLFLIWGAFYSKSKKRFVSNIVLYGAYFSIMVYIFSDPENFKYGGGLSVLFFSWLFLIIHFGVFLIRIIYTSIVSAIDNK